MNEDGSPSVDPDPGTGTVVLRPVTPDDFDRWLTCSVETFARRLREGEAERFARHLDLGRLVGAWDDDQLVGTAAGFDMRLTVPGGARLPCSGVSLVTVAPTHRRRGLLRAMMRWLFEQAAERGDPVAALYASEGTIYPRFGYGVAAPAVDIVLRGTATAILGEPSSRRLRLIDRPAAADVLPRIHDRVAAATTGSVGVPAHIWNRWRGPDTGDRPTQVAVLGEPGDERGYVVYRATPDWREGAAAAADGTLVVDTLMAVDDRACLDLWRYVLSIDLMRTFVLKQRPVDDPGLFALADPLAVEVRAGEPLWLRLLDVPVALGRRSYAADGSVCLELEDALVPANTGRWQLDVRHGAASVRRTDASPDLALGVAQLASAYLGGTPLRALVRGGRIRECTAGAAERADTLFASWPAPWNGTHF